MSLYFSLFLAILTILWNKLKLRLYDVLNELEVELGLIYFDLVYLFFKIYVLSKFYIF